MKTTSRRTFLPARTKRLFMQACLLFAAGVSALSAGPISLGLQGTVTYDGWTNMTVSGGYSGVTFPGTAAWRTTGNWTTYIKDSVTYGAIGSNTAGSGDAVLYKVSNGNGGPYPAGESIYFGGTSGTQNLLGGTLGVADPTPLAGVKTIAFQIEIGEAFGYAFYNNTLPVLKYTTESGEHTMTATFSDLVSQLYSGDIVMPTGYEDIYKNTWGVQFNLDGITESILSYEVQFSGVQHAQVYSMQMDTSNVLHESIVFPQAIAWDGEAGNTLWSAGANWSDNALPTGKEVLFETGTGVVVDSDQAVHGITFNAPGNFTVSSANGAALTVGVAGIMADGGGAPAEYTISAPVKLTDFALLTVQEDTTLNISGNLTAPGFYKKGEGTLNLQGDNTFSGNKFNRIILADGEVSISGTNTYTGPGTIDLNMKKTTVRLHGGDDRLGSNFVLDLVARRAVNGATLIGEEFATVILGDATGRSNQTVAGIKGELMYVFDEGVGSLVAQVNSSARILGGSSEISTLTVDAAAGASYTYTGYIGGAGANENNLSIVKKGDGAQILSGTSTYTGDTVVLGGLLQFDSATALPAASHVIIDGGVLGFGGGDFTGALGTGAGQLEFRGSGGFAASGAVRTVNLGGVGAQLSWGDAHFLQDGEAFVFSHTSATNTLNFANALNFGSQDREIQVNNGSSNSDVRLSGVVSGSGALIKTGAGSIEMTAANTYSGGTKIFAGMITVAGANGSLDGNVDLLNHSTVLQFINNASASNNDRFENTATITSHGQTTIQFTNSGNVNLSETVGKVHLASSSTTITTSQVGTGYTNVLTIGEITRTTGSVVNFSATTLGTRNNIMLGTTPTQYNGILGGWATTGTGNEFAAYTVDGIKAFANYVTTGESTWTSVNTVKITAGAAGITTNVTGNRHVNALNMVGATAGTVGNQLNLGGNQLRIGSGGLIMSGGNDSRINAITNGTVTAGATPNVAAELFVVTNGTAHISASITDNGTGAVMLVKSGSGGVFLNAANSHSGGTYVNQGSLFLQHAQALGTGTLYINSSTVTLQNRSGNLALTTNNNQVWNGNVTYTSSTLSNLDMGAGRVSLTGDRQITVSGNYSFAVGGIDGDYSLTKAGVGNFEVKGSSTYTGGTFVNAGTLTAAEDGALGTGTATIASGATLRVNSGVALSNNIVLQQGGTLNLSSNLYTGHVDFQGGKLTGAGTLNQAVTVGGGGAGQLSVLSPGNSPGVLNTLGQSWLGGGTFIWEINSIMGGAGVNPGWDLVNITGNLDLTGLTENAFEIDITSLTSLDAAGLLAGFDMTADYEWTILSASGSILGFDESFFDLNTEHFQNNFTGGSFDLRQSGNNLVLSYNGVPEPSRGVLFLLAAGMMIMRRRRKK